tara:strand:+ start:423 stop:698 length:276 start_codon:yes stop_codon:yes gene_type:complete
MFKLLSELNIDKKDYKNLALLPGFNINYTNMLSEKFDGSDIIHDEMIIKLITSINESKNNSTRKKKKNLPKISSKKVNTKKVNTKKVNTKS